MTGERGQTTFLIGWAETDLTPELPVGLAGQFYERIAESVESRVGATALALALGEEQAVLVSCDLLDVTEELTERTRALLEGNPEGLLPEAVILCATHTHTSLCYGTHGDLDTSLDIFQAIAGENQASPVEEQTLEFLARRIAGAVLDAWRARAAATYAAGFGRAAVGHCRRVCYQDGSARMWGDTDQADFEALESGNDTGLELLYTFDLDGHLTGVAVNAACPAQVMEHRSVISSDYWGKVRTLLRQELGEEIHILCLCGAAGDQCPRDMIRWVEPESPVHDFNIIRQNPKRRDADPSMFDVAGAWKIGRRIAGEVRAILDEVRDRRAPAKVLRRESMQAPLAIRRVTEEEFRAAEEAVKAFLASGAEPGESDNARMHVHAGCMARYRYQQTHRQRLAELHVLRLDALAFATNPFELFLDYGNRIRAQSPARQTFLIQLACGDLGYLPTARAEAGGHYSAYVASGIIGHEGGNQLVERTLEALNRLWEG